MPASLASQLPQWFKCQVRALWEPACWRWLRLNPADTGGCLHRWHAISQKGVCVRSGPCGSRLAGDGFGSTLQIQPVACIAGKPVPTRVYVSGPGPVGASLLAMASAQSCRCSRLPASLASQFPQGCMCQVWALWEPACWRWLRLNPADTAGCLHRWQASSHKGVWALWEEPACWRWFRLNPADTGGCLHRWQASSHKFVSQVGLCRALDGFAYGQVPHQQRVVQIHLVRYRQVHGMAVPRRHLNR